MESPDDILLENEEALTVRSLSLGGRLAWIIWIVSAVFVLFQFSLQLTAGVLVADLMKSFSLTALGGGVLASSYYYIYTLLQAPGGLLVDTYGARRVLTISAVVCGLGCLLFAMADHLSVAILGRLMMGLGASTAFVGSMNLVGRWFPLERFGFMVALAESSGMLGSLFGGYALAHLVENVGWRVGMEGAAGIGFILAIFLWFIIRDAPQQISPMMKRLKSDVWNDVKQLIKQPVVWINGIYVGFLFGIITVFVALWGIPFIQKVHHLSLPNATFICNLMFVGVAIGAPLFGCLDSHTTSRRALLSIGAFLAAGILCVLIFVTGLSVMNVGILMFFLGLVSSTYVINYVIANEVATYYTRGTSIGIANMFSVGTAPIFQPLIGLVLYLLSGHEAQTNFEAYTVGHFQIALSLIPLSVVIAGVVAFWLPNREENHT